MAWWLGCWHGRFNAHPLVHILCTDGRWQPMYLSMMEMNCANSVFQDQTIILKLSHQKITEKHTTKDDAMQLQASSAMVPRAALIRIHHISIWETWPITGMLALQLICWKLCYLRWLLFNETNEILKNTLRQCSNFMYVGRITKE